MSTRLENKHNIDRKVFGRKKSHRLRRRHARLIEVLLPELEIKQPLPRRLDLAALFDRRVDQCWLEIGFGGGEHLLWQARQNPQICMIGCEIFLNGIAKLLTGIEDQGLGNVRIYPNDACDILDVLPAGAIARVFLLFPDPWPKARHAKRRFVSMDRLDRLARVMAPDAELRIASDMPDYVDWILSHITAHEGFAPTSIARSKHHVRPDDWPATRYEKKALLAGRKPVYLRFRRAP
jgi:tRNA (guanine-N7-)-methyltransferase